MKVTWTKKNSFFLRLNEATDSDSEVLCWAIGAQKRKWSQRSVATCLLAIVPQRLQVNSLVANLLPFAWAPTI